MTPHLRPERITMYLDDGLTLPERRQIEQHAKACMHCRHELESLERVDALLTSWGSVRSAMPGPTQRRIAGSVARRRRLSPILRIGKMMPAAVGSSAAALLILVSVNLGMMQNGTGTGLQSASPAPRSMLKQSQKLIAARRGSAILGVVATQLQPAPRHSTLADVS